MCVLINRPAPKRPTPATRSHALLNLPLAAFFIWALMLPFAPPLEAAWFQNKFVVGPYLQTATPDSLWVMWETNHGYESRVELGTSPDKLTQVYRGTSKPMTEVVLKTPPSADAKKMLYRPTWNHFSHIHSVQLTKLTPETHYYYRVVTGNATSTVYDFWTPPAPGSQKSFRFAIYSDNQEKPDIHRGVVEKGIMKQFAALPASDQNPYPAFILNAGDIVGNGQNYREYKDQFFAPLEKLSPHVPYYIAIGNHDRDSPYYFNYFHFPENGTQGFEQHWYSFSYSNARFIALDTNTAYRIPQQLDWLSAELKKACDDPNIRFVFTFFHHPSHTELWTPGIGDGGATPGEREYSAEVTRITEEALNGCHKTGAQFFGHIHGYSRGQSADSNLYWVGVGSAGGTLDTWGRWTQIPYPEYVKSFPEFGYAIVDVTAGERPSFQVKRFSQGSDTSYKDNEFQDVFGFQAPNLAPPPPRIEQVEKKLNTIVVKASPFIKPQPGTYHTESEWQLLTRNGDKNGLVLSKRVQNEKWFKDVNTNKDVDLTILELLESDLGGVFDCRVRYRDNNLAWSPWSQPTSIAAPFVFPPLAKTNP